MSTVSAFLDRVYLAGAWLAGVLLLGLLCLVLYSILARIVGLYGGGAADVAGYVMATSTFLALAYTFRSQGHIRVSLLIQKTRGATRRGLELWCLGAMSAVGVYLAVYMARLVHDSWVFGDRSQGVDATPLWVPQLPVAVGSALFALAVLHTFLDAVFNPDADPDRAGRVRFDKT